jgi:hypothetical protein
MQDIIKGYSPNRILMCFNHYLSILFWIKLKYGLTKFAKNVLEMTQMEYYVCKSLCVLLGIFNVLTLVHVVIDLELSQGVLSSYAVAKYSGDAIGCCLDVFNRVDAFGRCQWAAFITSGELWFDTCM